MHRGGVELSGPILLCPSQTQSFKHFAFDKGRCESLHVQEAAFFYRSNSFCRQEEEEMEVRTREETESTQFR